MWLLSEHFTCIRLPQIHTSHHKHKGDKRMERPEYKELEMKIVFFESEDIITSSLDPNEAPFVPDGNNG